MQATKPTKLTARDFIYVNDEVFGPSYQNGPYVIIVGGRSYYAANYQGRTIAYNLRCFPAAIEACAKHDAARRNSQDVLEDAVLLEIAKLERRTGVRVTRRNQDGGAL